MMVTLESVATAERVSVFGGASGFWAVSMKPEHSKYAASHAWIQGAWHLVQPVRMMFGSMNATTACVRQMNKIYGPSRRGKPMPGDSDQQKLIRVSDDNLLGEIAEVFVDDTVAKSKEKQDHINDLARVLIRRR